jgi:uncharacterized protein GlcG (DUF336 family)
MRSNLLLLAALAVSVLPAVPARGADVMPTHRLSAALATDLAVEAIAACTKLGFAITAAVLDAGGIPQAIVRGDGAGLHTVQTAQDKAFTAITYGRATSDVAQRERTNGPSAVIAKEPRLIAGDGGLPITIGNEVVGALGISGSPGKDEVCGNAAIDKLRARLR